jgi:tetratricopeptide (TPR) repeat protein
VNALLPGGSCGMIVTSRLQFPIAGKQPVKLDLLSEADAIELARNLAPRLTENHANALAKACGYLALAIRLVATQVALYEGIPVETHLQDLTSDKLKYLDEVEPTDPDGLPFARRAIELSLERLAPELRKFWSRLSVFPVDFDHDLGSCVAMEGDEPDLKRGQKYLEELRRHALLEFDGTTGRYSLHDLAREYAWKRALLNDAARFALAKQHATVFKMLLDHANLAYLDGKPVEGLAMVDAELPSILAGQRWAANHLEQDADACHLAADYFHAGRHVLVLRLHSRVQIAWLEITLTACRKLRDRPGEGAALGNLGMAYKNLGDARNAIEYYEQQLVIAREIGDPHGNALNNLGLAHGALGDARKAIEYHEQALTVSHEIGDRRCEGNALGNLGLAHADLGDSLKAIEYHEQALKVMKEFGDKRAVGSILGNLGIAHAVLGDAAKAIEYYEQQLVIVREIGDRRGEGYALGNLGLTHKELGGDVRKAIEYQEQALTITREIGDRRAEVAFLGNLGLAHAALGDACKAIEYFEQNLVVVREIGDRHGEGKALFNRALLHAKQSAWCPAADGMQRAAAIFAGIEHPNAARAAGLAADFRRQCDGL